MDGVTRPKPLCCSFCLKSPKEVELMIRGHDGAAICNRCVEFCRSLVSEHKIEVKA